MIMFILILIVFLLIAVPALMSLYDALPEKTNNDWLMVFCEWIFWVAGLVIGYQLLLFVHQFLFAL